MAKKTVNTQLPKSADAEFPKSLKHIKRDRYFKPVLESLATNQILTIDNFFSSKLCRELIESFDGFELETTPLVKRKNYALRYNDRVLLSDTQTADSLWSYLKSVLVESDHDWVSCEFSKAVGLNPNFRVYRYKKGHFFENHYDESVKVGSNITRWTVLIYLTGDSDFKGGETTFENKMAVHPSGGMCLLHKHGDDCMLHQSELVTSGEKWVLRSDVLF